MTTYVLVPGLWLGGWAWHDVTAALRGAGHEVFPLTLTGVADRAHLLGPGVDLDTHTEDIVRLVETEDLRDVVLVGHSYGGMPVSAAALRLRERIARVIYVDSGPLPDGTTQLVDVRRRRPRRAATRSCRRATGIPAPTRCCWPGWTRQR